MDLNDIHKAQISRFGTFCKGKRDAVLAAHEAQKNNFVSDRLLDDAAIFNCGDVRTLLETYHAQVMGSVRDELEMTSNLSAAFSAQLLSQAQACGITLQVEDISIIEDQNRLAQLASLPALSAPVPAARAALAPVGSTSGADIAALQELQDLRAESQQMKERNMQLQTEMSTVLRERSVLSAELEQARSAAGGGDASAEAYARQLAETKAELEMVKREANQQLSESSQFRELKSILQKKSSENRDLRQRLMAAGIAPPDDGQGIELQADDD